MSDDRHDRQPRPPRSRRAADDPVRERDDVPSTDDDAVPGADAAAAAGPAEEDPPPSRETLDALAGQLVWRIGRTSDDAPLTVRVGLPSSTPTFAELPRLRSASDAEVQEAIEAGEVRVEWVGPRGR